jgi:hypothetical protein
MDVSKVGLDTIVGKSNEIYKRFYPRGTRSTEDILSKRCKPVSLEETDGNSH